MKVLAFDQATKNTGFAVYDNMTLVKHGTIKVSGNDHIYRLAQLYDILFKMIQQEQPDLISIEDVQFQRNYKSYAELSRLQGIFLSIAFALHIDICIVHASTWRSYCGLMPTNKRAEQKIAAIQMVNTMGIEADDDESEAILQGKYTAEKGYENATYRYSRN